MSKRVVIIDYSLGNMFSVEQALTQCGASPFISNNAEEIAKAQAIVLPGVGAFAEAMNYLKENNIDRAIKDSVSAGKQFLGICLGMQLLFTKSEEFGETTGLNLIEGEILKFKPNESEKLHVPQVGWNTIHKNSEESWKASPLRDLNDGEYMYFVHSFYAKPRNEADILSKTTYGGVTYCSSVMKRNIIATQFHPEKSGELGLSIYKHWLEKI
jgi:imidazole glycerol-phosphate synthase subunit HisH